MYAAQSFDPLRSGSRRGCDFAQASGVRVVRVLFEIAARTSPRALFVTASYLELDAQKLGLSVEDADDAFARVGVELSRGEPEVSGVERAPGGVDARGLAPERS